MFDLKELGLWNEAMKHKLIAHREHLKSSLASLWEGESAVYVNEHMCIFNKLHDVWKVCHCKMAAKNKSRVTYYL